MNAWNIDLEFFFRPYSWIADIRSIIAAPLVHKKNEKSIIFRWSVENFAFDFQKRYSFWKLVEGKLSFAERFDGKIRDLQQSGRKRDFNDWYEVYKETSKLWITEFFYKEFLKYDLVWEFDEILLKSCRHLTRFLKILLPFKILKILLAICRDFLNLVAI